jgi:hypothetical protein
MRREKEQSRNKMIKGQSRRIARTVEKKANIRQERNSHEYTFSHFQIVELSYFQIVPLPNRLIVTLPNYSIVEFFCSPRNNSLKR